jgi:hypothetical protein
VGGETQLTGTKAQLIELSVRQRILLDYVDLWLMAQPSLASKRSLIPVLVQRQRLADGLTKLLTTVGLTRAPKPIPSLAELLEELRDQQDVSQDGEEAGALAPPWPPGQANLRTRQGEPWMSIPFPDRRHPHFAAGPHL